MKPTPSSTTAKLDPDPDPKKVEQYEKGQAVVLTHGSVIPKEPT
jgi:hypothetical protein